MIPILSPSSEALSIFEAFPEHARRLFDASRPSWEYMGDPLLGFAWLTDYDQYSGGIRMPVNYSEFVVKALELTKKDYKSELKNLNQFNQNNVGLSYGLKDESLDTSPINFRSVGDELIFDLTIKDIVISGVGKSPYMAALMLFSETINYHNSYLMPSISDLPELDIFMDRYGDKAVSTDSAWKLGKILEVLCPFIPNIECSHKQSHTVKDHDLSEYGEIFSGNIQLAEGIFSIYLNYGIDEAAAKILRNNKRGFNQTGLSVVSGIYNIQSLSGNYPMCPPHDVKTYSPKVLWIKK